eukprot:CAMPEP_0197520606 /NCGR_PEP_ID=MMETSP1318-20131121/5957_1 /TAXON_ID=552666 /ORGANISM="Partenskyella glossopodia, Strain RCC365" /LENGTH=323 /DNA_ID=CAMNT_0043072269 /DNA_START=267 /DNA_END=1235 /DNA_ORIENTATION=+
MAGGLVPRNSSLLFYTVLCPCDECGKKIVDFAKRYPQYKFTLVLERRWKPPSVQKFAGYSDDSVIAAMRASGIRVLNLTDYYTSRNETEKLTNFARDSRLADELQRIINITKLTHHNIARLANVPQAYVSMLLNRRWSHTFDSPAWSKFIGSLEWWIQQEKRHLGWWVQKEKKHVEHADNIIKSEYDLKRIFAMGIKNLTERNIAKLASISRLQKEREYMYRCIADANNSKLLVDEVQRIVDTGNKNATSTHRGILRLVKMMDGLADKVHNIMDINDWGLRKIVGLVNVPHLFLSILLDRRLSNRRLLRSPAWAKFIRDLEIW